MALGTPRINDFRAVGWTVAVHNDYRLRGEPHTFWLLTHPSGRYVKGEGRTDAEALAQIADALEAAERAAKVEAEASEAVRVAALAVIRETEAARLIPNPDTDPRQTVSAVRNLRLVLGLGRRKSERPR